MTAKEQKQLKEIQKKMEKDNKSNEDTHVDILLKLTGMQKDISSSFKELKGQLSIINDHSSEIRELREFNIRVKAYIVIISGIVAGVISLIR